ncbi:MAG: hypothetical protein OHK93_003396 [Ramalina farinacea]|uniref:DUF7918 domain-containing protein n=1 Tax=Ramalina farinacea TaxID=258253 RepID=A0AA43QV68_9LECA|nr:hypothetical protein [Ramalina farinacea]
MPGFHNLTVSVTSEGKTLSEWGFQKRKDTVSTYVEANTDHSFAIAIQPNLPWTDPLPNTKDPDTASVPTSHLAKASTKAPDYALVAELYLDNAKAPARRCMIYLDRDNPGQGRDGTVVMKRGWTKDIDGNLQEQKWVFKERGLETVFARLDVGSTADSDNEEVLSASMDKAQIDQEAEDREDNSGKAGQITVNLVKAIVQSEYLDPEYTSFPSGDADDEGDNVAKEITHRATTVPGKSVGSERLMRIVKWAPYEPDGKIFASFIFRYRSQEILRRHGFAGFPPSNDLAKNASRLDVSIRKITPLSALDKAMLNGAGKRLRSGRDYQISTGKAKTSETVTKEGLISDEDGKEQETDVLSSTKRLRSGKVYEVPTPPARKAAHELPAAGQPTLKAEEADEESWGDIIDIPE